MTGSHEVAYEVAKIGRRVTLRPGKMVLHPYFLHFAHQG